VRKRELEVLGEELLDVWAADVGVVGDLDNAEDLVVLSEYGQRGVDVVLIHT